MDTLQIIEFKNQRILTTQQLAEGYETEPKRISENFNANKERYVLGKHYFLLEGDEKREFINHTEITDSLKNASKLYLWTEKGAMLHAKSLGTDKAWDVYDMLVETYFRVKENTPAIQELSPQLQLLINMELEQKKIKQQLLENKQEIQDMREVITLNPNAWRAETASLISKIALKIGGFEHIKDVREESYKLLDSRAGAKLSIRLTNRKRKVLEETGSKSKANKVTTLDVIAENKRLTEVYIAIVKEMAIKNNVA